MTRAPAKRPKGLENRECRSRWRCPPRPGQHRDPARRGDQESRSLNAHAIDGSRARRLLAMDVGAAATVHLVVTEADTAMALGSGDVAVLATPGCWRWPRRPRSAATRPAARGATTVGTRVELRPPGRHPGRARRWPREARLVDGGRTPADLRGGASRRATTVAARGRVERVVVDRERVHRAKRREGGDDRRLRRGRRAECTCCATRCSTSTSR